MVRVLGSLAGCFDAVGTLEEPGLRGALVVLAPAFVRGVATACSCRSGFSLGVRLANARQLGVEVASRVTVLCHQPPVSGGCSGAMTVGMTLRLPGDLASSIRAAAESAGLEYECLRSWPKRTAKADSPKAAATFWRSPPGPPAPHRRPGVRLIQLGAGWGAVRARADALADATPTSKGSCVNGTNSVKSPQTQVQGTRD